MQAICEDSKVVDGNTLRSTLGAYFTHFSSWDALARVRLATFESIQRILANAVREKIGPLELFSDKEFAAESGCILLFDKSTLQSIDRVFDLHPLWRIRASLKRREGHMEMDYMLLGGGKLILGYPGSAEVSVPDYKIRVYGIESDVYEYEPLIAAEIVNTRESRGLVRLRTIKEPDGGYQPFTGPFGSQVHSMEWRDGRITAVASMGFLSRTSRYPFLEIPISMRSPGP